MLGGFLAITVSSVSRTNATDKTDGAAFNASLAILGVLVVEKTNVFPEIFLSLSVAEMRMSLSNALDTLQGLDNGNTMISKCRVTLNRLLHDYDKLGRPSVDYHCANIY